MRMGNAWLPSRKSTPAVGHAIDGTTGPLAVGKINSFPTVCIFLIGLFCMKGIYHTLLRLCEKRKALGCGFAKILLLVEAQMSESTPSSSGFTCGQDHCPWCFRIDRCLQSSGSNRRITKGWGRCACGDDRVCH